MTGTIDAIVAFAESRRACQPALNWLRTQPDTETAWQACEEPGWLIWWLNQQPATEHKTLVRIACTCARTALRFVPQGEDRPRLAVETIERWQTGDATIEEVRAAAVIATSAAIGDGDVGGVAARAAAAAVIATSSAAIATYAVATYAIATACAAAGGDAARHQANIQMCRIIRAIARMDGAAI